jgi:ketosteroid isomerase-like protein
VNDPKQPKSSGPPFARGGEGEASNDPVEEFFQRLNQTPQMRRPRPNPDAIAEALQAIQKLGGGSEAQEEIPTTFEDPSSSAYLICQLCGYKNQRGNQFCGMCGAPVGAPGAAVPGAEKTVPKGNPAESQHHYHHHYHHHYLQGGVEPDLLGAGFGQRAVSTQPAVKDISKLRAPLTGQALSRAETAVRQMTQEWALACNNRQLDDLLTFYAPDALVLRPNVPAVRGAAAIREFFFAALDSGLGDIEMEALRVELLGDLAYEAGRCKMLVPFAVGKRREERGKYVVVYAKQGGEWKAVVDCWSSDLSLAVSPESEAPRMAPAPPNLPPKPRRL